ncbi:MAG: hypothetical protein RL684_2470 [Pseudomonadota bacterium]|jgi:hypothetical protein
MISVVAKSRSISPEPIYSHRLARGLTRDLHRFLRDGRSELDALYQELKTAALPYRSQGERLRVRGRAIAHMKSKLLAFEQSTSDMAMHAAGLKLTSLPFRYPDGQSELALMANKLSLCIGPANNSVEERRICLISQHAVERMFSRMRINDMPVVLAEIQQCAPWLLALHASCEASGAAQRIRQVAVPTRNGLLLCRRHPVNGVLDARTWVNAGTNERLDRTLAALHAWKAIPTTDTNATFARLLADPANKWMLQPYADN